MRIYYNHPYIFHIVISIHTNVSTTVYQLHLKCNVMNNIGYNNIPQMCTVTPTYSKHCLLSRGVLLHVHNAHCAVVFCYMCRGVLLHVQRCFVACARLFCYMCRGVLLHVQRCFVTCAGVFCCMCKVVLLHVHCAGVFCYIC